jgi:ribosomal protein S12 methylthiotransferase
VADLRDEAARLAARGVRELMLVSQNTSDFGRGTGESLLDLVTALSEVEDLEWIRLHYLYPGLIPVERFLRILRTPKVLPYVDMPVQHASENVLRRMNRPTNPKAAEAFFRALREADPEVVLRTTVLLGFPGEEEEDVEAVADFLAAIRFDHVGTYRYSPEAGTAGADMDDVPDPEEVADREARLLDLQMDIARERQLTRLGREFDLVVDRIEPVEDWRELLDDLERSEDRVEPAAPVGRFPAGVAVARSRHFAYEMDGVVLLDGAGRSPGERFRGRFIATTPFDVLAEAAGAPGKESA